MAKRRSARGSPASSASALVLVSCRRRKRPARSREVIFRIQACAARVQKRVHETSSVPGVETWTRSWVRGPGGVV
ncbi:hypothetical protein Micbo1qcDRAFT_169574, partial [Microdochium bolleyi]